MRSATTCLLVLSLLLAPLLVASGCAGNEGPDTNASPDGEEEMYVPPGILESPGVESNDARSDEGRQPMRAAESP